MSNILKVFIVLNLVLSVVFVATAATLLGKADNWKGKYEALDKQKAEEIAVMQAANNSLRAQLGESETARKAAVDEKDQMGSTNLALSQQLTEEKRSNEKLGNSVAELKDQMKTLTAALTQAQRDRELYERRMTTAEENARSAVATKETAEDDGRRKDQMIADLQEQVAQHERDLTEVRSELAHEQNKVKIAIDGGFNFEGVIQAPPIEAVVQTVNPEYKFVTLSVGSDDKVTKGMRFHVSRRGLYVGDVQVDNVYPKSCAARFIVLAPGREIAVGDTAQTRL
ncbi:MAG: hypothetical protein JXQ29_07330 [Planctomycetes bacterium]|nr:hypothetical protein [Planctomycetota bacterium]